MIQFISNSVKAKEPITSATAIVTGSDPELTNILLQQLAIALYCYKNKIIIDLYDKIEQVTTTASTTASSTASTTASTTANNNASSSVKPVQDIIVQEIKVEYSTDCIHWKHLNDYMTELSIPSQVVSIPLAINDNNNKDNGKDNGNKERSKSKIIDNGIQISTKKNVLLKTNFLKITPLKWINSTNNYSPSMRVQLQRQIAISDDEGDGSIIDSSNSIVIIPSVILSNTLTVLVNVLNILIDVMEYLQRSDDYQHDYKQMEVKRVRSVIYI